MKDSHQNVKYTEKDMNKQFDKLSRSVVFVLANEPKYAELARNKDAVNTIASSLLESLYKKDGAGLYVFKKNKVRPDMASAILDSANTEIDVEEIKNSILSAKTNIKKMDDDNSVRLETLHASVMSVNTDNDFDIFSDKLIEDINNIVYAGSDWGIPTHLKRDDLLFLDMILVAEGTNKNKDCFLAEELKACYRTIVGMPLVAEHIVDAIKGVYYSSEIVNIKPGKIPGQVKLVKSGGRLAIRAKAFVYKKRFPREAMLLKSRAEQGLLRFSLELGFKKFKCGHCGKEYPPNTVLCDHLIMRHSVDIPDYVRIPLESFFIGGAYTINPAEKTAVNLGIKDGYNDKDDKKVQASVNTIESGTSLELEDNEHTSKNGGTSMPRMFEFDSVEELLSAPAVQAVVEAAAQNLSADEKDTLATSVEELSEKIEASDAEKAKLIEQVDGLTQGLDEAKSTIASMQEEKKVSDALFTLQQKGFKFESDEKIQAFSDRIKDLDQKNVDFIVELMAKQIEAAPEGDPSDGGDPKDLDVKGDPEEGNQDLKASRDADINPAGSCDSLKSIRNSWDERIQNLQK